MASATDTKIDLATGYGSGGRRLEAAFEAVGAFPALASTAERLRGLEKADLATVDEVAELVEGDVAASIAVLRAANNGGGPRGRVASLPDAVEDLEPAGVREVVDELDTYEMLEPSASWARLPERFRRHAVATRHAADCIAELADIPGRDDLVAAALLHDLGQLVLIRLYPRYDEILADRSLTPEERARRERIELGMDHTIAGGVLARRWGLPGSIASAIERHHSESAEGLAAAVRLSDLIVHQTFGDLVSPVALHEAAEACGLGEEELHKLIYEFPHARGPRRRRAERCPLSEREITALRGLAEGKVYREIAAEMGLSASTVRTHLHNVYRKIDAADRAQAVLVAREHGWI